MADQNLVVIHDISFLIEQNILLELTNLQFLINFAIC